MRRRGVTLIEMLVVFALASLFVVLAVEMRTSVGRQAAQTEEGADLIREATILQERLTTDLEASLALSVLPEQDRPRGAARDELVLPLYAGYQGDAVPAVRYRRLRYRWDPDRKVLLRDGKPVVRLGIQGVRFRWSEERPTELLVELDAGHAGRKKGTQVTLRLPAPQGTDPLPVWVFARHHQGATPD